MIVMMKNLMVYKEHGKKKHQEIYQEKGGLKFWKNALSDIWDSIFNLILLPVALPVGQVVLVTLVTLHQRSCGDLQSEFYASEQAHQLGDLSRNDLRSSSLYSPEHMVPLKKKTIQILQ